MTPTAIYLFVAILGILFYGLGCFAIWGEVQLPFAHRIHQYLFNITGAVIGWVAGWPVFDHWFLRDEMPTFGGVALLLLAFIGVTGHLPQILALQALMRRRPNIASVRRSELD